MATMTEIICACGCGRKKMVRAADVKRGWGKFYSKACKAREQEGRTHQYRNYKGSGVSRSKFLRHAREYGGEPQFDRHGEYIGFTDVFSNEDHDCSKD